MKVQDHIRTKISTIHKDATFRDALEKMIEKKTNGLVVVDDEDHPVGIIDSFHLILESTPHYLQEDPSLAEFASSEVFHKEVSSAVNKKVSEMMQTCSESKSVHLEDPMILAATLASKHGVRYIPVIDDNNHIVGLVTRTDIKRAMASLLNIQDDPNA